MALDVREKLLTKLVSDKETRRPLWTTESEPSSSSSELSAPSPELLAGEDVTIWNPDTLHTILDQIGRNCTDRAQRWRLLASSMAPQTIGCALSVFSLDRLVRERLSRFPSAAIRTANLYPVGFFSVAYAAFTVTFFGEKFIHRRMVDGAPARDKLSTLEKASRLTGIMFFGAWVASTFANYCLLYMLVPMSKEEHMHLNKRYPAYYKSAVRTARAHTLHTLQTVMPLLRKYSLIVLAPCIAVSAWSTYERDRFHARILPLLHDSPQMFAKEIAAAQEYAHGVRRSTGADIIHSFRSMFISDRKANV